MGENEHKFLVFHAVLLFSHQIFCSIASEDLRKQTPSGNLQLPAFFCPTGCSGCRIPFIPFVATERKSESSPGTFSISFACSCSNFERLSRTIESVPRKALQERQKGSPSRFL